MHCKNDPKKTYKGSEPSPKGLGYCAHAENKNKIRIGLDGNKWIISATKKGTKRWKKLTTSKTKKQINSKNKLVVNTTLKSNLNKNNNNIDTQKKSNKYLDKSLLDCKKLVMYKKTIEPKAILGFKLYDKKIERLIGIQLRPGYLHKSLGSTNKFENKETSIPKDFKKTNIKPDTLNYYCNPKLKDPNEALQEHKKILSTMPKGYKSYFTLFDGGKAYLVYVYNNYVSIYKFDYDSYDTFDDTINSDKFKKMFVLFVKKYKFKDIIIGQSLKSDLTMLTGEFGKKYDGNTILLYLGSNGNKYSYVFIMDNVKEFTTNSKIINYFSPIGEGSPYPFAVDSDNKIYLLAEDIIIINDNNYIKTDVKNLYNEEPYEIYYDKNNKDKIKTTKLAVKIIDKS